MAPPTEAEVLNNYLIRPGGLDAILTADWVQERVPPAQRDHPRLRALWQDLVAERERALDAVRAAIEAEARRGLAMRREVLREKHEAERDDVDGEVELERAVRC
jgi:centromere-localized protein 2